MNLTVYSEEYRRRFDLCGHVSGRV